MDFACVVLFLALYHLKPQEWASIFSTIHFVQMVMFAALATLIFRERSLKPRDFFRTAHDWAMYFFVGWVVVASPTPWDTFKEFVNRLIFYIVIVQTLTNWERIRKFLGWWTGFVAATAVLALAGEYFWDPLGSYDLTHGAMKGRLVLNLSMVNNPNALAHTLAPAFSMLYYFCIWRRPLFMKEIGLVALIPPLWAIFLTESKGGYFVSAAVILATLTFGRPKAVQITLAIVLVVGGGALMHELPRMGELEKSKTDEAIQGRIRAFTYGQEYLDTYTRGVGQGQFITRLLHDKHYYKASHSTYVQTGAELGEIGEFLFLLVMWCNLRTLLFAKTETIEQERIRRILFVLVASYAVSGWMVDFAYRPTFFMFTAAIAAFHRHLYRIGDQEEEAAAPASEAAPYLPAWRSGALAAAGGVPLDLPVPVAVPEPVARMEAALPRAGVDLRPAPFPWQAGYVAMEVEEEAAPAPVQPAKPWTKLGLMDLVMAGIWLKATLFLWEYAIEHI